MPKEIWSEGRIVGESAYEIYVKQHLMEDPDTPPATEREWLASSIAMGSSLIVKLATVGEVGVHTYVDIMLPFISTLAAANTIVASFFNGEAEYPTGTGSKWATKIISYGSGDIVSNTSSLHPVGTTDPVTPTNVPSGDPDPSSYLADELTQLRDYMRIVDGVIIQPGTWTESGQKPPEMDFIPNLSSNVADSRPVLRLHIVGRITSGVQIMLTGFTIRSVLSGISKEDGSTSGTDHPTNGDFLGPEVFPWASKVIFSVPTSYINYLSSSEYKRVLLTPTGDPNEGSMPEDLVLTDVPMIDMKGSDPGTFYDNYASYYAYYTDGNTNPRIQFTVSSVDGGHDIGVLTVYQRKSIYPPALYGTLVDDVGQKYLNPLDVVAPGTVKVFYEQDKSVLIDYENTFPGTTAINKKSDGSLETLDSNNDLVRITTNFAQVNFISNDGSHFKGPGTDLSGDARPAIIKINKNLSEYAYALSVNSNASGSDSITIDSKPNASTRLTWDNSYDNITWSALIGALRNNRGLNLLDTNLKTNKYSLYKPVSEQSGDDWNWNSVGGEDIYDHSNGASFLQFGTDDVGGSLRLYGIKSSVSTDPRDTWNGYDPQIPYPLSQPPFPSPQSIPLGSLATGVGWHSIYRVHTYKGVKAWTPTYGAEFDSGIIEVGAQPVLREFIYGIIVFGQADTATISGAGFVPDLVNEYTYYLPNIYSAGTDWPTVVWIDAFGNPYILHQGNVDYMIGVSVHYEQSGGEMVPHTDSVELTNNTNHAATWMMIGRLHHVL